MSRVRTPSSLKWLIDKRARLSGEISKLEGSYPERLKEAKAQVAHAEIALDLAKKDLAQIESGRHRIIEALRNDVRAIDSALALHEIQISPEIIPPIHTPDAEKFLPYGSMTRSIFEGLKIAGGKSMTTCELADYVASSNRLTLPGDSLQIFRDKIRYRLKALCNAGKIRRLHQVKGAIIGRWALPYDPDAPIPEWADKVRHPRKKQG